MIKRLKDCHRCLYYIKESIVEESMCLKFSKLKTYLNGPQFERAKACRLDPHKCGESGVYYISNLLR